MQKVASLCLASVLGLAVTAAYPAAPLTMSKVIVGPYANDDPSDFSLRFTFHTANTAISTWQLGFYMPRNFRTFNKTNRKLTMQICETGTRQCNRLVYLQGAMDGPDLSSVFTTVLGPSAPFKLRAKRSYTVSLLHNSAIGPLNYSSLPQSFFLATPTEIYSIATTAKNYVVTNYKAQQVQTQIQEHIRDNWLNSSTESPTLAVIPEPQEVKLVSSAADFKFNSSITLVDPNYLHHATLTRLWQAALKDDLNLNVALSQDTPESNAIILKLAKSPALASPEAYQIIVNAKHIQVTAAHEAGLFYGLQTLRQLWFNNQPLQAMQINDAPHFRYRGMHLDSARHFFKVSEIKNFLDIMASLKLNTLHWHLSDDEAFRLQLESLPELTTIGSRRGWGLRLGPQGLIQTNLSQAKTQLPSAESIVSGSYSPSELNDIISYANARQITIIPEIDIPGHSRALMRSRPASFYEREDSSEYGGYGDNSLPVCTYGGNSPLGVNFTADLRKLLLSTAQLFAKQTTVYARNNEINIGGDEVSKQAWSKAPSCNHSPWQKLSSLQKEHYFFSLLAQDPNLAKLQFSGWHEFLLTHDNKLDHEFAITPAQIGHVYAWGTFKETQAKAVSLANAGYPVVLNYADSLYFDMRYTPALNEPGFYWATNFGDTAASLSSLTQAALTLKQTTRPEMIQGLEGALWTDVIPDYAQLQYMAFPKMAALAEASWVNPPATAALNWQSLAHRLGCGINGYLAFIHTTYGAYYRGYPDGIKLEAPQACPAK